MLKIGDKIKLDEFGLKQWPNYSIFEVIDLVYSDEYGSGCGVLSTLFTETYIDADYFVLA